MKKEIEVLTGDQFLEKYEELNFDLCTRICDNVIEQLKLNNPNRKDMVNSDWLKVFMYEYIIEINGDNYILRPIED